MSFKNITIVSGWSLSSVACTTTVNLDTVNLDTVNLDTVNLETVNLDK